MDRRQRIGAQGVADHFEPDPSDIATAVAEAGRAEIEQVFEDQFAAIAEEIKLVK